MKNDVKNLRFTRRGATTAEKVEGDQGLGSNTGALAGCLVREGSLLLAESPPENFLENSYAKSCTPVTTCCDFFAF